MLRFVARISAVSLGLGLILAPHAVSAEASWKIEAPALARTASSILLIWDSNEALSDGTYEVLQDGRSAGTTAHHFFTVGGLNSSTAYHFAVRARDKTGELIGQTSVLGVSTAAAGAQCNVRDFGAVGDGRHADTDALRRAITACSANGTVLVPAGTYLTDHLDLKSDMTLRLERGATLLFLGSGKGHYPKSIAKLGGPDGDVAVAVGALISGTNVDNVRIVGDGAIQGNGETWWAHPREFRPKILQFVQGKNIFVQGITVIDPPFWAVHPLYVDHVIFCEMSFLRNSPAQSHNADGLDLDSCRDVLVVGCKFGNQDDSLVIKSGKVGPSSTGAASRRQRASENIVVSDCRFDASLGANAHPLGFAIGSEISGGVRHVSVHDCEFVNVASLCNIKTNRDRYYSLVEDVSVENCRYSNTVCPDEPWARAPISLDLFYYNRSEDPEQPRERAATTPLFRDIRFRNLTIDNPAGRAIYLCGLAEQPLEGISFDHVTAKARTGLFSCNVDGITLRQVTIEVRQGLPREWRHTVHRVEIK